MENMMQEVVRNEEMGAEEVGAVMETATVEVAEDKEAKPMTLREFYEAVAAREEITDEMVAIAAKKIEQLDKKNEYARNHKKSGNSKKAKENAEVKAKIAELMADGTARKAKEIAEALDLTQQKVSALARQMVEEGKLTVDEEKVKGGRLVKVYTKVAE